jgi:nitric oxide reductase large subunit
VRKERKKDNFTQKEALNHVLTFILTTYLNTYLLPTILSYNNPLFQIMMYNNFPNIPQMPHLPVDDGRTIIILSVILAIVILAFIAVVIIMLSGREIAIWFENRYGIVIAAGPPIAADDSSSSSSIYHDARNCGNL